MELLTLWRTAKLQYQLKNNESPYGLLKVIKLNFAKQKLKRTLFCFSFFILLLCYFLTAEFNTLIKVCQIHKLKK